MLNNRRIDMKKMFTTIICFILFEHWNIGCAASPTSEIEKMYELALTTSFNAHIGKQMNTYGETRITEQDLKDNLFLNTLYGTLLESLKDRLLGKRAFAGLINDDCDSPVLYRLLDKLNFDVEHCNLKSQQTWDEIVFSYYILIKTIEVNNTSITKNRGTQRKQQLLTPYIIMQQINDIKDLNQQVKELKKLQPDTSATSINYKYDPDENEYNQIYTKYRNEYYRLNSQGILELKNKIKPTIIENMNKSTIPQEKNEESIGNEIKGFLNITPLNLNMFEPLEGIWTKIQEANTEMYKILQTINNQKLDFDNKIEYLSNGDERLIQDGSIESIKGQTIPETAKKNQRTLQLWWNNGMTQYCRKHDWAGFSSGTNPEQARFPPEQVITQGEKEIDKKILRLIESERKRLKIDEITQQITNKIWRFYEDGRMIRYGHAICANADEIIETLEIIESELSELHKQSARTEIKTTIIDTLMNQLFSKYYTEYKKYIDKAYIRLDNIRKKFGLDEYLERFIVGADKYANEVKRVTSIGYPVDVIGITTPIPYIDTMEFGSKEPGSGTINYNTYKISPQPPKDTLQQKVNIKSNIKFYNISDEEEKDTEQKFQNKISDVYKEFRTNELNTYTKARPPYLTYKARESLEKISEDEDAPITKEVKNDQTFLPPKEAENEEHTPGDSTDIYLDDVD